jgi:hypothetical protein
VPSTLLALLERLLLGAVLAVLLAGVLAVLLAGVAAGGETVRGGQAVRRARMVSQPCEEMEEESEGCGPRWQPQMLAGRQAGPRSGCCWLPRTAASSREYREIGGAQAGAANPDGAPAKRTGAGAQAACGAAAACCARVDRAARAGTGAVWARAAGHRRRGAPATASARSRAGAAAACRRPPETRAALNGSAARRS